MPQRFENAVNVFTALDYKIYMGNPGKAYQYQLAPATNTQGYRPGCILSRITANATVGGYNYIEGTYINFNPSSTTIPGQNTATNVLVDPDMTFIIPPGTTNTEILTYLNQTFFLCAAPKTVWQLIAQYLYATATDLSDVTTGIAQLQNTSTAQAQYISSQSYPGIEQLVYVI